MKAVAIGPGTESSVAVPPAQRRPTMSDVWANPQVRRVVGAPRLKFQRSVAKNRLSGIAPGSFVHLGCGLQRLEGWVNVDNNRASGAEILIDLRAGFPAPAGSVRMAFSEHVIEHLEPADSKRWLADLHASMLPGGVVRIATPDLAHLVGSYLQDWRDQDWVRAPGFGYLTNGASMLNLAMRGWGHRFVFDEESLTELLVSAGFGRVVRCRFGESEHPELSSKERRIDSKLILEARR